MKKINFYIKTNLLIKRVIIVFVIYVLFMVFHLFLLKNTIIEYDERNFELDIAFDTLTQINDIEDNIYITSDKITYKDEIITMEENDLLSNSVRGKIKIIISNKDKDIILKGRPIITFDRKIETK